MLDYLYFIVTNLALRMEDDRVLTSGSIQAIQNKRTEEFRYDYAHIAIFV